MKNKLIANNINSIDISKRMIFFRLTTIPLRPIMKRIKKIINIIYLEGRAKIKGKMSEGLLKQFAKL